MESAEAQTQGARTRRGENNEVERRGVAANQSESTGGGADHRLCRRERAFPKACSQEHVGTRGGYPGFGTQLQLEEALSNWRYHHQKPLFPTARGLGEGAGSDRVP